MDDNKRIIDMPVNDIDRKKKIIELYGNLYLLHQHIEVTPTPRMLLESKTKQTRIYGYGVDDDKALLHLYENLYRTIKHSVKATEYGE